VTSAAAPFLPKEKVLPFLYGPKDTGKTTFVEAVMDLMGEDYAKPAAPDLLLSKRGTSHPTEVADLLGRRFVATVEVEDRGPFAGNRILDVSPRTAEELGMKRDGTARVEIAPIEVPQRKGGTRPGAGAEGGGGPGEGRRR